MTTKTLRYTTLKGLLSKTQQFSFQTMLSKRFYHKKFGHIKFKLSQELEIQILNIFSDYIGVNLNNSNIYNLKSYGIYERFRFNKSQKAFYITCQSNSEITYLRNTLKKEVL